MSGIDQSLLPMIIYIVRPQAILVVAYCIPRPASQICNKIIKTNEQINRMLAQLAMLAPRGEVTIGTADRRKLMKVCLSCCTPNCHDATLFTLCHRYI